MTELKCYTCQAPIKFDENVVSKSGKKIPLNLDNTPHDCQGTFKQASDVEAYPPTSKHVITTDKKQEIYIRQTASNVAGNLLQGKLEILKDFEEFKGLAKQVEDYIING